MLLCQRQDQHLGHFFRVFKLLFQVLAVEIQQTSLEVII